VVRDDQVDIDDIFDRDDLDFGSPLFHGLPGRKQHAPPYDVRNNDHLLHRLIIIIIIIIIDIFKVA